MPYEFKATRIVEFAETDMAGIVHFTQFFRYMESTEHAFFRSLGFSIHPRDVEDPPLWPRVHVSCEYKQPLRFEDEIEVHLIVRERRPKVVVYDYIFRRLSDDPGVEIARGTMTAVCVIRDRVTRAMKSAPIPHWIAEKIEPAPPGYLS